MMDFIQEWEIMVFSSLLGLEFLIAILLIWDIQVHFKVDSILRRLFYCSIILAWVGTATFLFDNFPGTDDKTIYLFFTGCAVFNFIPVLLTFAWRIHVTFSATAYGFSRRQNWSLGLIIFFLVALPIPRFYIDHIVTRVCLYLFFAMFAIASCYVMRIFYSKFVALVSEQAASMQDVHSDFNQRQQELIGLAAKYTLLFVIASVTSMGDFVAQIFFDNQVQMIPDQFINCAAIYLQFAFVDPMYMKCCWPCHKVTRFGIAATTKTLIFAEDMVGAVKNIELPGGGGSGDAKDLEMGQRDGNKTEERTI